MENQKFFIDSLIDEDTSVMTIAADMEKDCMLFMRLMYEANQYNTSTVFESADEVSAPININENVKKYGSNYAKVLNYVTEAIKKNNKQSDKSVSSTWFFSNIIFFTNERDSSKNKTLKKLEEAVNGKNVNLIVFVADEVTYKATDHAIEISDSKNSYTIKEQSNADTICIARLGVQDSEQCMQCVKEIQSWGIFTLNPVAAAKTASNKYETAVLLEKYGIPQPRFTILTVSDIADGESSLVNKLDIIYKGTKYRFKSDNKKDKEQNEKQEYVLKVLDGHGGTGVFMLNGKSILAVLQAIFVIDPDRELLLQKKESADGGDIRVHVLSFNKTQKIVAAMKRVKIDGDFRSNVSLGATSESVTLSKEQEEIAFKTAKVSGMPWCAVDIMPLKKGSNSETGDNVVLEYNASPGTDGISDVIGENFVTLLLDSINEMKDELPLPVKQIGYIEDVNFILEEGEEPVKIDSKFDTGNGALAPTLGVDDIEVDGDTVKVKINDNSYIYKINREISPKVGQSRETRVTVLIPEIIIGTRKLKDVEFAVVTNRDNKSTRALINRDVMRRMGFVINPNLKNSL